ncbi:bifunctional helix-turn-helix transcriptional regulator/GNAT family N-acetyltransferase [Nocardiopsis composta]|uniref:DNA-binding MarR family transcriptional regulator/GNAT superfamily N-acetyltransferase n=1 Tax=Nocardiopsis composta TaxID=157465 RepID=A0A7W8QRQ4_9ACTN|nr:helix-turn-helix domain-containing GNAT family N-acetyltransferase [Nocardiopsis composta]MBB5434391.1 DNA-binding MarR family transcriptional regulator/GNAT superfamily N-acetyltransferase [Nocardiopsis composta]
MDSLETTASAPDGAAVPAADIARLRAFNRFLTARVGALDPGHLDSPWSLTEVRAFHELLHRGRSETSDLRRAMDIDAGQLSRVLARLESAGLVVRAPSPADGRKNTVELTPAGARAAALMDARADAKIGGLLAPLTPGERARLTGALAAVRELLAPDRPAGAPAPVLRPLGPGDLGWVLDRHGALYAQEYGWGADYEALVAKIVADFAAGHDPERERGWIAELDGERVGSVFCTRADEETAQLRLLLLEPAARGHGLGRRLVEECMDFARAAGYRRMKLWTQSCLTAARSIYSRAGFTLRESRPHRDFGDGLVAEVWDREL